MPFQLKWTPMSRRQLGELPKNIQVNVIEEVGQQLIHQPDQKTRHRKRLRENPLATWELRVGDHRVFYNVEAGTNEVEVHAFETSLRVTASDKLILTK